VVPKYPHPITQRGVRSMAIFPTDEDRRAYLQFFAEEAERFRGEIWFVELNPVRAGIVKKAWVYPGSSASFPTGRSKRDPLGKDRQWEGWVKKRAEFLTGTTRVKDQAIQQMTRTGRPAGNAAFVDLGERLTDRDLSKGKPGRPVTKDK
jgi:hypothetical protein